MLKKERNILKTSKNLLLILIFSFLIIIPIQTLAIGQISKPIIIEDALRGQSYQEEMVIFNTEKVDIKILLSAEGDIGGWVKFYKLDDAENPVTELEMKAGSNTKVNAIFSISESAPNGEYKGAISARTNPQGTATTTETQVITSQKIDRPVTINISDNEIIKFAVSVIPSDYDLATDEALTVRIIYDNQGNIDIRPQIEVKILKEEDEQVIHNVIYPYPEDEQSAMPNSRHEISPLVLQTIGYEKGRYLAQLNFLVNDESGFDKQFAFSAGIYNNDNDSENAARGSSFKDKITLTNIYIAVGILIVIFISISAFFIKKAKNEGSKNGTRKSNGKKNNK